MSFTAYMVNRNESPAIEFEGTYSNEYVAEELAEARSEGFEVEPIEDWARVVYLKHEDGRPWVYREFYPVEAVDTK